jgi:hypothetical protein
MVKLVTLFISNIYLIIFVTAQAAHAASLASPRLTCSELFGDANFANGEGLPSVRIEELKVGRSLGQGEEGQASLIAFNGKKAVLKLFDQNNALAKLYYQDLSPEQKAELARLDYHEALRREHEVFSIGRHQQSTTVFDLAAFDQAKWIIRAVDSRRMRGLRYQGRKIAPEISALVRNPEGLIIGLVAEYVPGKSLHKLIEAWSLSNAEIDEAIDQAIEQIKILGANGFYHGDPAANIVVTFGRDRRVIARLIDFNHIVLAPANGRARWQTDIDLLEQKRREWKGEPSSRFHENGRFLDLGF